VSKTIRLAHIVALIIVVAFGGGALSCLGSINRSRAAVYACELRALKYMTRPSRPLDILGRYDDPVLNPNSLDRSY
jgi:hypothetical protein